MALFTKSEVTGAGRFQRIQQLVAAAEKSGDSATHAALHPIEVRILELIHGCRDAERVLRGEPLALTREIVACLTAEVPASSTAP